MRAFAGFDLPVDLHLPHGMVGVVDAVDAQGVETLGAGLLAQPAGERGILAVAQLRGQPHLSGRPAGRTRVRAAGPVPRSPAFGGSMALTLAANPRSWRLSTRMVWAMDPYAAFMARRQCS